MIKLENCEVMGWEAAIRGMRNPMNSWAKSDSGYSYISDVHAIIDGKLVHQNPAEHAFCIGKNDWDLMTRLRNAGTVFETFDLCPECRDEFDVFLNGRPEDEE